MRELGRTKDRTISIEYRWAEGRTERFAEIAAEFVRLKVDVVVTAGSAVPTIKRATPTIPVIFAVGNDPVGSGLVASLASPAATSLGCRCRRPIFPANGSTSCGKPARISGRSMANTGVPAALLEMNELQAAARSFRLDTIRLEIRRTEDITPAIEGLKGRADALHACADSLLNANRVRICTAAIAARLLTMYTARE
jgi:putative ABC transport system substrate-binding protein